MIPFPVFLYSNRSLTYIVIKNVPVPLTSDLHNLHIQHVENVQELLKGNSERI